MEQLEANLPTHFLAISKFYEQHHCWFDKAGIFQRVGVNRLYLNFTQQLCHSLLGLGIITTVENGSILLTKFSWEESTRLLQKRVMLPQPLRQEQALQSP
ncbi:MAG: hypothetical protein PUP92_10260 [Rhizonema sp. PD38]|nr:hypothetical protein [Rhizonema sp. PD38]